MSRLALSLQALPGLFFAQSQHRLFGDISPQQPAWVLGVHPFHKKCQWGWSGWWGDGRGVRLGVGMEGDAGFGGLGMLRGVGDGVGAWCVVRAQEWECCHLAGCHRHPCVTPSPRRSPGGGWGLRCSHLGCHKRGRPQPAPSVLPWLGMGRGTVRVPGLCSGSGGLGGGGGTRPSMLVKPGTTMCWLGTEGPCW